MKKILTIIMGFMLIGVDVNASPLKIELELFRDDDTPIIPNPSKGPEEEPCVYQDGSVNFHGTNGVTLKNNFEVQTGASLSITTGN